jgi:lipoate-protein ligase A
MKWHYINTGFHSGEWNMSLDEQIARSFDPAIDIPLLRIYGWRPFTISLGVNQRLEDFDLAKIHDAGIGIIRRPTGGRAIYHAHELTYSIILDAAGRSAREVYQYLSRGILAGLHLMGIDATLSGMDEHLPGLHDNPLSIPCFSTSTRSEIQWHGKKIVGSAQRRYGNIILQHGSFLLGKEHRRICEYLSPQIQNVKTVIEDHLTRHTIEAQSILQRVISFDEAATCLRKGFEQTYDIAFLPYDQERIQKITVEQQFVQTS